VLSTENKRRDRLRSEGHYQEEYGYVERPDEQGKLVKQRVDKALLDLTDRENLAFRYPL